MGRVRDAIDEVAAATRFSGVVRVDRGGGTDVAAAYGSACRAHGVANTVDTRLAIASGVKGLTALAVMSLVEEGRLDLSTPARTVLGDDLPLIAADVTVEHLLAHRSGIGDYLDEDSGWEPSDHVMPVPVHELATTEDYLRVLDGFPTAFPAGERFAYCNGGYVVLALIAERAAATPYHELVAERVCRPAGMVSSAFLRSDELPGDAAVGYLDVEGLRTNVLHLPVRGVGDGGMYATVADMHAFWAALLAGRIVPLDRVAQMVAPVSDVPEEEARYGLGFWLGATGDAVQLDGYDAGVSFRSVHAPSADLTYTVISNTSEGAWPVAGLLRDTLGV
jgi:CubicO group peptidase (beta-lactamase class C family)